MSIWNFVVTAHKPTNVTHSCVGNFTGPQEVNLIIAKCTRIEIHVLSPQGLQPMLDVPIYGRIATLELFRPHGESQDLLFIATERYKFCVLQWDAETAEIGIIDPDCRLIGLHLYDGLFKVIPFDNKGQLKEAFNIRLEELQVLDIKFLFGCPKPTIVVLYQDNKDARHVKTYEVTLKDKDFIEGPWSQNNLDNGAELLIPVPPPLCGVLIIGEETIVYCSASAFKAIPIRPSITRAYGRVDADGSRYLLGDHNGLLHLLVITHAKEKVTGLKIEFLGETSVASSISYLDNAVVFVGSSYGDSQLIKLNLQPDAKGSYVEVLERYVNLGPIVDFCVVDLERQGQGQVVTCSGAYKDGSLRIVRNGIGINEQLISETRILAMNLEDELEETEIEGFCSNIQTLFCHDAMYDQLVQVTSNGVRLVSSTTRELCNEWFSPAGYSINVATANATQVLLATGGGHLVYLEIGDGVLTEVKHAQLEYDISCLDINPIGDNPNYSQLAAVGMWTDISVRIYSLPDLNLITKEHLGGEIIPRSVLLCSFEGVGMPVTDIILIVCSWGWTSLEFSVEYDNKKLLYSNVNLKEVSHMCPFNSAAFPDSLAIAKEGELTIGTIDDIQKLHIRSIPLEEHARRICHQEQTRTFAICSLKYNQSSAEDCEMHFIRLLDDQTFEFISTYPLDQFECGCSILSCSFSDDNNVYYCVGTAYVMPEENEPTKGRILVFAVEDGKLQLIAEKETKGAVYSLNAFNGKLLAAKIRRFSCISGCFVRMVLHEEGAIEERARDYNANWMSAVEILDDDIYLGAENNFNLFTVRKNSEGATDEERGRLEVVGEYHLGEFVNRFRHGSLVMRLPDSDVGQIPTVIFGTVNGVIGVIASLPHEQYVFLEKLQTNLRKVIKGVGGLSHEQWRSFYNEKKTVDARNFLDGDLLESFLDLSRNRMEEISKAMNEPVEELMKRVEELTRLH
ncbi:UNVERIFIED_CONTAM: DNA damage-binding protein 1 [Sesamum radiatum]|uniref:DNA damage-binding protein 1 n=1 Tax=Sesamum radiatum TaxID=300843 RepID=A0AAW2T0N8_SESRA